MIYTVFCTGDSPYWQWQAELLEYSWKKVGQAGALVRLITTDQQQQLPRHQYAKSVATRPTAGQSGNSLETGDVAAAVLTWLDSDWPCGTVLLLDADTIFRAPLQREVSRGNPVSQPWTGLSCRQGNGSSRPGADFAFLSKYSQTTEGNLPPVTLPMLIHTADLHRIVDRWLELSQLIRENATSLPDETVRDSDKLAYIIAAAEIGLQHELDDLCVATSTASTDTTRVSLVSQRQPIKNRIGETIWSRSTYVPWTPVHETSEIEYTHEREFINTIREFIDEMDQNESYLAVPLRRRQGVLECRLGDEWMLEYRGSQNQVWLNQTAQIIWELCDGTRTQLQITNELRRRFPDAESSLDADVNTTVKQFITERVLWRMWPGPIEWADLSPAVQQQFLRDGTVLELQKLADNRLPFSNAFNIPDGLLDLLEQDDLRIVWPARAVDSWTVKAQARHADVAPPAYPGSAGQFYRVFDEFPVQDLSVLVAGSASPWVEAILLAFGARHVLTTDYLPPECDHPNITTLAASSLGPQHQALDAIVSYSSIEHDGLGRYGDAVYPEADIEAVHRFRDLVREDGLLFLAVPVGEHERLVWNHHRIYGLQRFGQLIDGWRVVGFAPWVDDRDVESAVVESDYRACFRNCDWKNQPIFVLRKA